MEPLEFKLTANPDVLDEMMMLAPMSHTSFKPPQRSADEKKARKRKRKRTKKARKQNRKS